MNHLPTGMYRPMNSPLHKMNACVKIIALVILLAAAVATDTLWGYAIWAAALFALAVCAKLPAEVALGSAKRLRWFFIIILVMNTCFFGPENPWMSWWIFRPSYEGLMQGINVVARVFIMLVLSNILTVSTSPLDMTGAIEKLLLPLSVIKIPTDQIAMILSVAIQFIPTIFEETDMIRKAQTARGARFDSRKLTQKAAAVIPLAVPIFLAAFKRADELSLAMEARGYRTGVKVGAKRKDRLCAADFIALMLCAAMCAVQIAVI